MRIRMRNAVQSESSRLHWDQADFHELASVGIHFDQVHQGEIAPEFFVSSNTLIVRDEVAATVQDQTISIDFDGSDGVGGVTVDEINTSFSVAAGLDVETVNTRRSLVQSHGVARLTAAKQIDPARGSGPCIAAKAGH